MKTKSGNRTVRYNCLYLYMRNFTKVVQDGFSISLII